jgi:hypothetical protein
MNAHRLPAYKVILSLTAICEFASAFAIGRGNSQALEGTMDYSKIDSYVQSQMNAWRIPGATCSSGSRTPRIGA